MLISSHLRINATQIDSRRRRSRVTARPLIRMLVPKICSSKLGMIFRSHREKTRIAVEGTDAPRYVLCSLLIARSRVQRAPATI